MGRYRLIRSHCHHHCSAVTRSCISWFELLLTRSLRGCSIYPCCINLGRLVVLILFFVVCCGLDLSLNCLVGRAGLLILFIFYLIIDVLRWYHRLNLPSIQVFVASVIPTGIIDELLHRLVGIKIVSSCQYFSAALLVLSLILQAKHILVSFVSRCAEILRQEIFWLINYIILIGCFVVIVRNVVEVF